MHKRVIIEVLAPPLLAAVLLLIRDTSSPFSDKLLGFIPLLLFTYGFGIVPSFIYMVAMEFWFRSGLHARYGLFSTVGLSAVLGTGAGFLSFLFAEWTGFLTQPDSFWLVWMGALVGLLIGFYVGKKQPKEI